MKFHCNENVRISSLFSNLVLSAYFHCSSLTNYLKLHSTVWVESCCQTVFKTGIKNFQESRLFMWSVNYFSNEQRLPIKAFILDKTRRKHSSSCFIHNNVHQSHRRSPMTYEGILSWGISGWYGQKVTGGREKVTAVSLCLRLPYCQSCQSMDFPSLLCLHMPSAVSAHAQ